MKKRRATADTTIPLFPAGLPDFVARNKDRLHRWTERKIFFGTSSWKYPGWKGMVYNREYPSQKVFETECLAEYAAIFPTVCADFALYDFPDPETMQQINDQTPAEFHLALKVTDRITIRKYPDIPRYGALAGTPNPDFLNETLFAEAFLDPLKGLGTKCGAIIFEFSTFHPSSGMDVDRFTAALDRFLAQLPQPHAYAVEVRNEEFLTEEYLAMLRSHGVAHVLNNWTRMPPVVTQIGVAGILTSSFSVLRGLLKPGRTYAEAVAAFKPYDRIREENPELREGVVESVRRCLAEGRTLYVYINNRAEGNSPKTIEGILDNLEEYPYEKL